MLSIHQHMKFTARARSLIEMVWNPLLISDPCGITANRWLGLVSARSSTVLASSLFWWDSMLLLGSNVFGVKLNWCSDNVVEYWIEQCNVLVIIHFKGYKIHIYIQTNQMICVRVVNEWKITIHYSHYVRYILYNIIMQNICRSYIMYDIYCAI